MGSRSRTRSIGLFLCFFSLLAAAQETHRLRLERLDAPDHHRVFRLDRYYQVVSNDSSTFGIVVSYNDSVLFLERQVRIGDSLVHYPGDREVTIGRYRSVLIEQRLDEIEFLEIDAMIGRTTFLEPLVWIGAGGVFASSITWPFAVFGENGDHLGTWAIGTGISAAVMAIAAWTGNKIKDREEKKRWRLVRPNNPQPL